MYGYYQPTMQTMPQTQFYGQKQEIVRVNGENGARTYAMPPNSSALLLDESAPIVFLATTDGAGYKTITAYEIKPFEAKPVVTTADLEQRIKRLEDTIYESYSTGIKSTEQHDIKSASA